MAEYGGTLLKDTEAWVRLGQFVDYQDAVTPLVSLSGTLTVKASKDEAAAVSLNGGDQYHDADGYYIVRLSAVDVDTNGSLHLYVVNSGVHITVDKTFTVQPANVFNSFKDGTDRLQVDAREFGDTGLDLTSTMKASVNTEADTALTDYDAVVPGDLPANFGSLSIDGSGRVDVGSWLGTAVTRSGGLPNVNVSAWLQQLAALGASSSLPVVDAQAISDSTTAADNVQANIGNLDAAISGLNDLSAAQVNAEVDTALADYDAVVPGDLPANFGSLSINGSGRVDVASWLGTPITMSGGMPNVNVGAWRENLATPGRPPTKTEMDNQFTALNDLSAAEVNAEVDTAIVTYGLDHLVFTSVAGADVADDSIIAQLASKSATADWDTFVNTTDSLEAISDSGGGGPTAADIADAVWDEAAGDHVAAGSFGEQLGTDVDAILVDTNALNDTKIPDTISLAAINAEVDTALTDYDAVVPADLPTNFGTLSIDGLGRVDVGAWLGTSATVSGGLPNTNVAGWRARAVTVSPTTLLPEVDAKSISDDASSADSVQSNIGNLDLAISSLNDLSAAAVNAEVDTALADYDAPTKAELDAGFAALNDLSAAEVNAEVDTALADYDAPTKAELDAGLAALNDISVADIWDLTDGVETGVTPRQALRAMAATLAGESSGVAAGSPVYRAIGNAGTTRVSGTASSGDRSSVTLNL